MRHIFTLAGLDAILAVATPASAHVNLAKSNPGAKAAVASPGVIELQFSGKVEPRLSGFDVLRADGSKVALTVLPASKDGRSLAAKPAQPLAPGAYKVAWRIVSTDGHRMTGGYDFSVR